MKRPAKAIEIAAAFAAMLASAATGADSYPNLVEITAPGVYESAEEGTDFVVSGSIGGDVSVSAQSAFRVTLENAMVSGTLALGGGQSAVLLLTGENAIASDGASAIDAADTASFAVDGRGSLSATAQGAKKTGVIAAGGDFTLAGGVVSLTVAGDVKNACGASVGGDYSQVAGFLSVTASGSKKQNGVFMASKNAVAAISGGCLRCELAGEKSVGLALDKDSASCAMTGGVLSFALSGDGAKGVKGDGAFSMSGGLVDATLSGGVCEDCYEYEDGDGVTWNYYVKLTSSTKTSGGSATYSTGRLIASGVYPVMDPSKCYAVKVGTLGISGGTVRVRATGTAGRGLGADSMRLSGGVYDIEVSGGPTDVYVEMLDEDDPTSTCLDSGSAACIRTGDESGSLVISGGTFDLRATGDAGKLINAAGSLVIGTKGQETEPGDAAFLPDIQGSTSGKKVFCTAVKQKYYGSLATPVATTNLASMSLSVANDKLVASAGEDADYSNPKGVKAVGKITVYGGRLRVSTANDGGEGLESKGSMSIAGGLLELVCADDCINSGGKMTINDGWIYAASTGNDAIDCNGTSLKIKGGVVLAFTSTVPECGIDLDSASGLQITGGHVVSLGSATEMAYGSSGAQKTYRGTSVSASEYAGKYLVMKGSKTVYVKIPEMSDATGTLSLVCTTEGWSTAGTPATATSAPSSAATGFHGVYIK